MLLRCFVTVAVLSWTLVPKLALASTEAVSSGTPATRDSSLDLSWRPVVLNGSLAAGWDYGAWQAQVLIPPSLHSAGVSLLPEAALRVTFVEDYGLAFFRSAVPFQGLVLVSMTLLSEVR